MKTLTIKSSICIMAISSFLIIVTTMHFGLNGRGISATIFTLSLLSLAIIDWQIQLLPDKITLPLLVLGLLFNFCGLFCSTEEALMGIILGYSSLWLFAWIFQQITGKVGMGHGDFKLLATLGAWLGWHVLPFVILFASVTGSIIGFGLIIFKKMDRQTPISFGPFLALAGWIALIGVF